MEIDVNVAQCIVIFVDENQNIVIFPFGKSEKKFENIDGTSGYKYYPSYYPIELVSPYSEEDLAEKIRIGIEEWGKHPCYVGKTTYEEKYYGVKGFKNAVKGKKMLYVGWNKMVGKYVSLSLPCKRGYSYLGIAEKRLSQDSTWVDFAKSVIEFINMDLTVLKAYNLYKNSLNE